MIQTQGKSFVVDCPCGREIAVTAADAGSTVSCDCGAVAQVPKLSELRQRSGAGAYVTSIADTIAIMAKDGRLPPKACVICHSTPAETIECDTVCELPSIKEKGRVANVMLTLFLLASFLVVGWIVLLFRRKHDVAVHGHEKIVRTPLSLCQSCRSANNLKKPDIVKQLMQQVPEYAELLNAYPEATVHVVENSLGFRTRF